MINEGRPPQLGTHCEPRNGDTADPLLVCVSSSRASANLVRIAHRMAAQEGTSWIAVHAETEMALNHLNAQHERATNNLRLAEQLGAEAVRLTGGDPVERIIEYARERGVGKIFVGRPAHPEGALLRRSFIADIVRKSPGSLLDEEVRYPGRARRRQS